MVPLHMGRELIVALVVLALLLLPQLAPVVPTARAQSDSMTEEIRRLLEEFALSRKMSMSAADAARIYEELASCSQGSIRVWAEKTAHSLQLLAGGSGSASQAESNMSLTAIDIISAPQMLRGSPCNWTTIYMALLLGISGQPFENGTIMIYTNMYLLGIPGPQAASLLAKALANLSVTGRGAAEKTLAQGLSQLVLDDPYAFTLAVSMASSDPAPSDLERALSLAPRNSTLLYLAGVVKPNMSLSLIKRVNSNISAWYLYQLAASSSRIPLRSAGDSALRAMEPVRLTLWERLYHYLYPNSTWCNITLGNLQLEPLIGQSMGRTGPGSCPHIADQSLLDSLPYIIPEPGNDPLLNALRSLASLLRRNPWDAQAWGLLAGATSLLMKQAVMRDDKGLADLALSLAFNEALINPLIPLSPYWTLEAAITAGHNVSPSVELDVINGNWQAAALEALNAYPYADPATLLIGLASTDYRPINASHPVSSLDPLTAIEEASRILKSNGSLDDARWLLEAAALLNDSLVDVYMLHAAAAIAAADAAQSGANTKAASRLVQELPSLPYSERGSWEPPSDSLPSWAQGFADAYKATGDPSLLEPVILALGGQGRSVSLPPPSLGGQEGLQYRSPQASDARELAKEVINAYNSEGISRALEILKSMSPEERAQVLREIERIDPEAYKSILDMATGGQRAKDFARSLKLPSINRAPPSLDLPRPSIRLSAPHLSAPLAGASSLNPMLALGIALVGLAALLLARERSIAWRIRVSAAQRRLEKVLRSSSARQGPRVEAQTIIDLYTAMLKLLALLERAKLPSETHREYQRVLRGLAREIHGEAMRIYEKAKFAGEPPSPEEMGKMRMLAERLVNLANTIARIKGGDS